MSDQVVAEQGVQKRNEWVRVAHQRRRDDGMSWNCAKRHHVGCRGRRQQPVGPCSCSCHGVRGVELLVDQLLNDALRSVRG